MSLSKRLKLSISGMTCTGCEGRLQTALNKIAGVDAQVSFASQSAECRVQS